MKIIVIYAITLLLSSPVFAFQDGINAGVKDQNKVASLGDLLTYPQGKLQMDSAKSLPSAGMTVQPNADMQPDDLLTEISVYALIVLVYSLYYVKETMSVSKVTTRFRERLSSKK